jgi:hypothetical protein
MATKKSTEITHPSSVEKAFSTINELINKSLVPKSIRTVEEGVQIIKMGYSLGMDEMTALNSLEFIQGNLAIKSKIIPGLLAKKGVAIQIIKDFEIEYEEKQMPVKKYIQDPKTGEVKVATVNDKELYILNEDGTIKMETVKVPVDRVTTVKFIRYFPELNQTIENLVSFRWSMAKSAGWDTKANWKANPAYMMMARCISRGARLCASDIIGGLYDNYELQDVANIEYTINQEN